MMNIIITPRELGQNRIQLDVGLEIAVGFHYANCLEILFQLVKVAPPLDSRHCVGTATFPSTEPPTVSTQTHLATQLFVNLS